MVKHSSLGLQPWDSKQYICNAEKVQFPSTLPILAMLKHIKRQYGVFVNVSRRPFG